MNLPVVLHEARQKPLLEFVAVDAEVNRLLVVLHVGQSQRAEGRGRRVPEGKRAESGCSGLAARAARGVMNHASAEAQIVLADRPRERVAKLYLVAEDVGLARLADGERHV